MTASSVSAYNADYYAIDFQFGLEEQVSAVSSGTVIYADDAADGYGNKVIVDHGGGYTSIYAHLNSFAVAQWATVSQGQVVGGAGGTGGYAVHLHMHMQSGLCAYRAEPMSRATGFGWYGFSVESGLGCGNNGHDPSPYWTSWPPVSLIEGTLFKASSNDAVYVADQGKKRPIGSAQAFEACVYHWGEIVTVPDTTVNMMSTGSTIGTGTPCPYTLVKSFTNGTVYVIWWQAFKQVIASAEAFNACGYNWGYIVSWSDSALSPFITLTYPSIPPCFYTRYPWYNNAVMEDAGNGAVYLVLNDSKRWVPSTAIFEACGYKWDDLVTVPSTTANMMGNGPNIGSPPCNYTLVKGSSDSVYVISRGLKRPVVSAQAFEACGYVWSEIVTVSDTALNQISTGSPLNAPPCPYTRS